MFGIGPLELVFIFVVALLVFGPKKLPELARTVGKGLAEFRRASSDLRRSMDFEIDSKTFEDTSAPAQTGSPHVAPEPGSALDRLETESLGSQPPAATQSPEAGEAPEAEERVDSDGGAGDDTGNQEAHPEYEPSVDAKVDVKIDVETETRTETDSPRSPLDQGGMAPMPAPRAPETAPVEGAKKTDGDGGGG